MALAAQAAEDKISKLLDALATKTDVDQMEDESRSEKKSYKNIKTEKLGSRLFNMMETKKAKFDFEGCCCKEETFADTVTVLATESEN